MSKRFVKLVLRLGASLLVGLTVSAHAAAETAAVPASPRPDVRVLIDISGSMKQTDPDYLRRSALAMLVQLYPKGARGGVWQFDQGVEELVPYQEVSGSWRDAGRRKAAQIGSTGLFTNIPLALEKATADIERPDPGFRTSVILLTDGMVDVSKDPAENAAAGERLLKQIVPRLRERGVTVHTVALSKQADRELMQRLAVDTGGLFTLAETPEKLNKAFLQVFDAAAPAEQVPMTGNQFQVDSAIDELTALIFHKGDKPVALKSPDGHTLTEAKRTDNVNWFRGQGFDLITISKPLVGQWVVDTEFEPGTRITIVSNLNLATTRLPESLFINNTASVTAALKEKDQVLVRPELLKLVTFRANVQRRGDGKVWQQDLLGSGATDAATPASNGYYRTALPMLTEVGTYDIAIDVDGKTFQRSQKQTVAVRENFIVKVDTTDTLPPAHTVTLFAQNPEIVVPETRVTAHIKAADGQARSELLTATGEREWQLPLPPAEHAGRVEVHFEVAGHYRNGDEFAATTQVTAIDDTGSQVVAGEAAKPVAAEVKHEPEPEARKEVAPKEAEHAAAEPAHEPPAHEPSAWKKYALWGGIAAGNLLLLGIGFFAFRRIMGGSRSKVLDEADDLDEDADDKAAKSGKEGKGGKPGKEGKPAAAPAAKLKKSLDDLDLPDDTIDIDPAADSKKK
jgi:uncharacterized protein (TIGR03503 family)